MKQKWFILALVVLLGFTPLFATDYYVKNGGNDAASGLDDDNAWETIAKVNGESFSGDDIIYFNKGDTWREELTIPDSGTSGHQITFGAYGTGADPIITATDLIETWTENLATTTLGDNSTTTENCGTGLVYAQQYTTDGDGGVLKSFHHYGGANASGCTGQKCAIYADAGDNTPEALVANTTSEELTSFSNNTWAVFNVTSGATLAASTKYWIAWFHDTTGLWGRGGDGVALARYDVNAYNGFPNPMVDTANFTSGGIYVTLENGVANVWEAACTTEPNIVIFDGTVGTLQASVAACTAAGHWFWDSNVLYIYHTEDPDGDIVVEAGARDTCITAHNDYITIDNLHLYGSNDATGSALISSKSGGGGDHLTIDTCTVEKNLNHGIYCININNVTATDCTVQYNGDIGLYFLENSDSYDVNAISVSGGTYQYNVTAGVYFYGSNTTTQKITNGGTVSGITATKNGSGIYFTKADGITVTGCTLHTNDNEDAAGEGYGIGSQSGSSNIIYLNTIYDNRTRAIEFWGESGAQSDSNQFYRNNVYGNGDYGIQFSTAYSDNNQVYYNLVHSNTTTGIYMGHNAANSGNAIYNNVLYNNGTYDMDFDAGADGYTVRNNIFYTTGTYGLSVTATTTVTHSNNCYYKAAGNVITYNGTPYTMATAPNFEATCVNEDPLMTDPGNDDFTIPYNSPCVDGGADVSLTQDYLGLRPRHAPDIGAYENQTNALFHQVFVTLQIIDNKGRLRWP